MAGSEIQVLNTANWRASPARLKVPGVKGFALAPGPNPCVAAYIPEAKAQPAKLRIHALPTETGAVSESLPLGQKTMFRVSACKFMWASTGKAVLAWTTADVDASNQSYYGESALYLLAADGQTEVTVPLSKEGPVHDVEWSPKGNEFCVVYGFMPAKSTTYAQP